MPVSVGALVETERVTLAVQREMKRPVMPRSPNIVIAEQWICFLLGLICMVCGGWGICMKYCLDLSSGYISWLGSACGPALRFTAVACLVSGAALLRRGLARPDMSSVSGSRKVLRSAGGNIIRMQTDHPFDGIVRLWAEVKRKKLT